MARAATLLVVWGTFVRVCAGKGAEDGFLTIPDDAITTTPGAETSVAEVDEGEVCNGSLPPQYATVCKAGLECVPKPEDEGTVGGGGICQKVEYKVVGEGETCNGSLPPKYATLCEAGLECVQKPENEGMVGADGICQQASPTLAAEGEKCNEALPPKYAQACEAGLYCSTPPHETGGWGVCVAKDPEDDLDGNETESTEGTTTDVTTSTDSPEASPTLAAEGEKCNEALPPKYAQACEAGLYCATPPHQTGAWGVCTVKAPVIDEEANETEVVKDAKDGAHGSRASTSTVADVEADESEPVGTTSAVPAGGCLQDGLAYAPLIMNGTVMTTEVTAEDCQLRCKDIDHCAHFSFVKAGGSCYLQDASAAAVAVAGFISGPPGCDEKPIVKCFRDGVSFSPMLETLAPIITETAKACQKACSFRVSCAYFSYNLLTNVCALADANAFATVTGDANVVAGPVSCDSPELPTQTAWTALAGGDQMQGLAAAVATSSLRRPPAARAAAELALPSLALGAMIGLAALAGVGLRRRYASRLRIAGESGSSQWWLPVALAHEEEEQEAL